MAGLIVICITIGITMVIFSVGIVALVYAISKDKEKKQNPPQVYEPSTQASILICPVCGARLSFMMPNGSTLYCNQCNKHFRNKNGTVGEECDSPYTRNDVYY
ncbi:MAG: hypothetical protein IJ419_07380 [Agathobacter sp.]|nr:hypothetical protein [Agathobacter sp.]